MSHTPGPWTLLDDQTFSTLGDKRVAGANKISPAIVFGGLGEETEANARLIAAAPELLEALKEVTDWLASQRDFELNNALPEEYAAVENARAVIAKAEAR